MSFDLGLSEEEGTGEVSGELAALACRFFAEALDRAPGGGRSDRERLV